MATLLRLSNVQYKGVLAVYLLDREDAPFGIVCTDRWLNVLSRYAVEVVPNRRLKEFMGIMTFRSMYAALLDCPDFANAVMQSNLYNSYRKAKAIHDHPYLSLVTSEISLNLKNPLYG